MATRTISTKLAIEGESRYRESISRINGEIKTLQSSLKLTESRFQTNANSMEALEAKGKSLEALLKAQQEKVDRLRKALENAQNAEVKYANQKADLNSKFEANNKALTEMGEKTTKAGEKWIQYNNTISKSREKLESLKNSSEDTSKEQEKLEDKIRKSEEALRKLAQSSGGAAEEAAALISENKKLSSDLDTCEENIAATEKGINSWKNQLNYAQIKLNDLDAEIKLNNEYLEEAKHSSDHCATSIDRFGDRVKDAANKSNDLRDALAAAGVIVALKKTADALSDCCKSSIEFESAMAGVAKTTDLSQEELGAMADAIQDMSTRIPASTTEIAGVVEAAGQLGIAKGDLLSFAEVMVNLGNATNLSSTEAASSLAKFANVVGMAPANYERLGSTIVALGNNFATTEADIVSMATRLSSTGAIVGLREPQIMAIATALSSVGIEAEAGGTAISKLLKQFETMVATGSPKLEGFAEVAGMTAEEFSQKWGEDAVGALGLFIDGLGAIDDAGGSSAAVLDELGIKEQRLSTAIQSLSSSRGILQSALNTADSAWVKNVALAKEAETRYATTESKLTMLSNACDNVKKAIGDKLTPAVGRLADEGTKVLSWTAQMIEDNDTLVPLITAAATAISVFSAGIVAYTAVTKLAAAAMGLFNAVMDANRIFLAATAVAALAAGFAAFKWATEKDPAETVESLTEAARDLPEKIDEANEAYERTKEKVEATAETVSGYIDRLRELEGQGEMTAKDQMEYQMILDKIRALVPDLNVQIDEQTGCLLDGADALEKQVEGWKNLAIQEALTIKLKDQVQAYQEAWNALDDHQKALNVATEESIRLAKQRQEIERSINEVKRQYASIQNDENLSVSDRAAELDRLYWKLIDLDGALAELDIEIEKNKDHQDVLRESIDIETQTVEENAEEMSRARERLDDFLTTTEEAAAAADGMSGSMANNTYVIEDVKNGLKELAESYKTAYDAAYDSISKQVGLFDKFEAGKDDAKESVEEMVELWNAQARHIKAYTENLQKASAYGLEKGLIAQLSDGSAESAKYLATIIDQIESAGGTVDQMSENAKTFVTTFNKAFNQTEDAKKGFSDTVAEMETGLKARMAEMEKAAAEANFSGFNQAVDSAFAEVGLDFQEIGKNCGIGLSQGLADSKEDVYDSGKELGKATVDGGHEGTESHSPSQAWYRIGENCGDGLSLGLKSKIQTILSDAKSIGLQLTPQMQQSAKQSVDAFDAEFNSITGRTSAVCAAIAPAAVGAASGLPGAMADIGTQSVNGMINGMTSRSSALYRTISSIVSNSIEYARRAAAVHSPSKKTTEIFEYVGDGMVVGLENRRQKIKDTAQDVVNDALNLDVNGKVMELSANAQTPDYLINTAVNPAPAADGESVASNVVNVYLNIDKFENNSDRDLDEVADYIEERIQTKFAKKEAAL